MVEEIVFTHTYPIKLLV